MSVLAERIEQTNVAPGSLAIFWLAQSGFVFKNPAGKIIYIDPYLSDVVERLFNFKRMMASPIAPQEVVADLVISTHEHADHLDLDALPIIARHPRTQFVGPIECVREYRKWGIPEDRFHLIEEGSELDFEGIRLTAVFADHGELAPDALGIALDFDGTRVYHTGDTAYRPEKMKRVMEMKPDIFIPCINGRYGNLNHEEAAHLAHDVGARIAIASHFWMFVEHNGDPAAFLEACQKYAPRTQPVIMKPGECFLYCRAD